MFDLSAAGEQINLLADHLQVAGRLRSALDAYQELQTEPLWPWITTKAINVDGDLSQQDQPEDAFAYRSN